MPAFVDAGIFMREDDRMSAFQFPPVKLRDGLFAIAIIALALAAARGWLSLYSDYQGRVRWTVADTILEASGPFAWVISLGCVSWQVVNARGRTTDLANQPGFSACSASFVAATVTVPWWLPGGICLWSQTGLWNRLIPGLLWDMFDGMRDERT